MPHATWIRGIPDPLARRNAESLQPSQLLGLNLLDVTHERVDPPRSWDDLEVFEDYLRGPEVAHRSPRTQSGRSREASAQKARLIATAVAVVLN